MIRFREYAGMGYEQASREAERLITNKTGRDGWFLSFERLAALREIMMRASPRQEPVPLPKAGIRDDQPITWDTIEARLDGLDDERRLPRG